MKTSFTRRRAFIHSSLFPLVALIGYGGVLALGVVGMRHQISATANHTRQFEQKLAQTERDLAERNARITAATSVAALESCNTEWQLGLVPPREPQVVRVAGSAERLLALRGTGIFSELVSNAPASGPVRFSVSLPAP